MRQTSNVVSLSGGKDSTAMLLMLLERGESVADVMFFDTGWEFPEMYEHLEKLETFTGLKITRLRPRLPVDVVTGCFPNIRWPGGEHARCIWSGADGLMLPVAGVRGASRML